MKEYRANGKILLTSEYMILHGAKALAVPLCLGQSLTLHPKKEKGMLWWRALHEDKTWFETQIRLEDLDVSSTSDREKSEFLCFLLRKTMEIQPEFKQKLEERDVSTLLDFHPEWGFGSSSTLTSLVSQWAGIDPMQLHFRISRGSGYDVACAQSNAPILYELIDDMPVVETVEYSPAFIENLWLIYLGTKQRSDQSISSFFSTYTPRQQDIEKFSRLTYDFLHAATLKELEEIVHTHEQVLGQILQAKPAGIDRFSGFDGFVKSLGAWGGDFALVGTKLDKDRLSSAMKRYGVSVIFSFKELMCHEK